MIKEFATKDDKLVNYRCRCVDKFPLSSNNNSNVRTDGVAFIDTPAQNITPPPLNGILSCINAGLFRVQRSQDDNPPIVRLYTKAGLVREEHVAPLSSSSSEVLLCLLSAGTTVARC
ncbi:hypothetical protein AVEN_224713-1 [Araneus ventricosus]|uniref:Uncharacterized protein n=1 Tax=Araneus ventricosus TaxID=182803 RepID=A0A4Y2EWC5_ARAVE|nr:hypothetical protein AVEN_224713-1 [Araneus ventricosus]